MLHNKPYWIAMNNNVIPQTYDSSLSMQEKIDYILYLLKDIPNLEDKLKVVDEMIENINKTIAEDVAKELQVLKDNGELTALLTPIVKDEVATVQAELEDEIRKTPFPKNITLRRQWRDIYNTRYTPQTNDNKFHRFFAQGCHTYYRNGRLTTSVNFNGNINSQNTQDLKMNDIVTSTYTLGSNGLDILNSPTTYAFGHANGMTYNPTDDKLYIVAGSYFNADKQYVADRNIYRVDPDFMNNAESKTMLPNGYTGDIAYDNGKMYILTSVQSVQGNRDTFDIREVNWDAGTTEFVSQIIMPDNGNYFNFDIRDGVLYIVCSELRVIHAFNIKDGSYISTYTLPLKDATGSIKIREIEGISVMSNGDVYIMTCGYSGYLSQAQNMIFETFKGNLKTNVIDTADSSQGVRPMNNTAGNLVFVCPDRKGIYNPTGSYENPFTDLNECIEWIDLNQQLTHCRIRIMADYKYQILTSTTKAIDITGYVEGKGDPQNPNEYIVIGGAYLQGCPKMTFEFLKFKNSTSNMKNANKKTNGHQPGVVGLYNSTLYVYHCFVDTKGNEALGYYPAPTVSENNATSISTCLEGFSVLYYDGQTDESITNMGIPDTAVDSDGNPPKSNLLYLSGQTNLAIATSGRAIRVTGTVVGPITIF